MTSLLFFFRCFWRRLLAQELIASKIGLRAELDAAEERADAALKELHSLRRLHAETDQDRTQIAAEAAKVRVFFGGQYWIDPDIYFCNRSRFSKAIGSCSADPQWHHITNNCKILSNSRRVTMKRKRNCSKSPANLWYDPVELSASVV